MKKIYLFFAFVLSALLTGTITAQTQVADFTQFDAAYTTLKATAGGGTIELTANVEIGTGVLGEYKMESTPANPITVNCGTFKLTSKGSGNSVDPNAFYFTIGANITITGIGDVVIDNSNRGKIKVAGGTVTAESNGNDGALNKGVAISGGAGWVVIESGTVETKVNKGIAVNSINSFPAQITGGTIKASADEATAYVGNGTPGDNPNITGATFIAAGVKATAISTLGGRKITLGDNVTIQTSSSDNSDIGLKSAGAGYIVIYEDAQNFALTSSKKYSIGAATSTILNFKECSITGNVTPGAYDDPFDLTLTLTATDPTAVMRYTVDGSNPTIESPVTGSLFRVSKSTQNLKVCIEKNGAVSQTVYSFTYTINNDDDPAYPVFGISSFQDLKDAYLASQAAQVVKATLNLGTNITINEDFEMLPPAAHEVEINAGANKLIIGATTAVNVKLGGALTVSGTSALISTTGIPTITFEGGTYETSGGSTLMQLPGGGNGATVIVNDGTFTVKGTGTNARGFQVQNTASKILFNNGNLTVGGGGRGFHVNVGSVYINGGNITMSGTSTASQLFRVEGSNNTSTKNYLEINGGTLSAGTGDFIVFATNGTNGTCVVSDATVSTVRNLYTKASAPTGTQLVYDFRGYTITATPPSGEFAGEMSVTLDLDKESGFDFVDAADASIRYTIDGTDPTAASTLYTGAITLPREVKLIAVVEKGGLLGNAFTFTYGNPTGIGSSVTENNAPYISGNVLYLNGNGQFVQIFNINGQSVLKITPNGNAINIDGLSSGIYIVNIDGKAFKIVK